MGGERREEIEWMNRVGRGKCVLHIRGGECGKMLCVWVSKMSVWIAVLFSHRVFREFSCKLYSASEDSHKLHDVDYTEILKQSTMFVCVIL